MSCIDPLFSLKKLDFGEGAFSNTSIFIMQSR